MAAEKPNEFAYYSPVEGRVVARFGSDTFIGASRGPKGFRINPEVVVAIPANEGRVHLVSYRNAVRRKDLVVRTAEDYDKYLADRQAKSEARAKQRVEAAKDERVEALKARAPDKPQASSKKAKKTSKG